MLKPVTIIRNLEDSPDWLDQKLLEAYWRTEYRVGFLNEKLHLARPHPPAVSDWLTAKNIQSYAFITASNPRSQLLSEKQNALKNKALERDLKKVSRFVFPGLGDGGSEWPAERSFWALDISPENAVALGKKYGQNAIVWWEKGGLPELWWLAPRSIRWHTDDAD